MNKRLERSEDRVLAGVCAGIAEWLGWSPVAIRALFVLVMILTFGFAIGAYLLLWGMMPPPDEESRFRLDDWRSR